MKRFSRNSFFSYLALGAATLLSACSEDVAFTGSPETKITGVTITAPDFVPDGDMLTRTEVNISQLGAEFLWQVDDLVGIYPDKGTQVRFPMENGAGSNTAKFDGGGWAVKGAYSYMAYYPFIPDMNMDKTAIPADYSGQRQHGSNNHDHIGRYDYMTATRKTPTEDGTVGFSFLHMGALVRLTLPVTIPGSYKELVIQTTGDIPVCGTFDITKEEISLEATNTTHEFIIALDDINTVNVGEDIIIFFMFPPANLQNCETYIILRSDNIELKYPLQPKNYEAGKIYAPEVGSVEKKESTKLLPGTEFNAKLKTLANNKLYYLDNPDYKIKKIIFKPNSSFTPSEEKKYVSIQEPYQDPIYAEWDEVTGTMTIHSDKEAINSNEYAAGMFNDMEELTSIDFSGINTTFTQDFNGMFKNCYKLREIDLSSFNFSRATQLDQTFEGCRSITRLSFSEQNHLENITSLVSTWSGCINLEAIDLSLFSADGITTSFALTHCNSLKSITANNFHFSGECNDFVSYCTSLEEIDLSQFDFSQATHLIAFFTQCENLKNINFGTSFDTQNVVTMGGMFDGCSALKSIDLSHFDTRNVEDMAIMFRNCGLNSIDLSPLNTEKARYMHGMFAGNTSLKEIDLSSFTNPEVVSLGGLFQGCTALESITFGENFGTQMCTSFGSMFEDCWALQTLDLSIFDTNMAKELGFMFKGCRSLVNLDLSNFNTKHVESIERMFEGCQQLKKLDISNFEAGEYLSLSSEFSTGAPGFGCEEINYGAKWDFDELLVPYDESQTAEDVSYKKITCLPSFMQRLINHAPILQTCKDNGTLTFINAETGETM